MYKRISVKSGLNKLNSNYLPYCYDLNIYRGCSNSCMYCFAKYSHKYLDSNNFFNDIFIKENICEILEKELSKKSWKKDIINIGGVTDSYQEIERKEKIMPNILKLMIKYKNPIMMSTKSNLILRDIELFKELAKVAFVNIGTSIISTNEDIRKQLEPFSSTSNERFEILKIFSNNNIKTTLLLIPIIPYLTDDIKNIETLFINAKKCNLSSIIFGFLNLKGCVKSEFLRFLQNTFPKEFDKLTKLYNNQKQLKKYFNDNKTKIIELYQKYEINNFTFNYPKEKQSNLNSFLKK